MAFKPESDDIRDSPALEVADRLAARRANVVVTGPHALRNARVQSPQHTYVDTPEEAVDSCDAVLLLTDSEAYRTLDPEKLGRLCRDRRIVDGRNALNPQVCGMRAGSTGHWDDRDSRDHSHV